MRLLRAWLLMLALSWGQVGFSDPPRDLGDKSDLGLPWAFIAPNFGSFKMHALGPTDEWKFPEIQTNAMKQLREAAGRGSNVQIIVASTWMAHARLRATRIADARLEWDARIYVEYALSEDRGKQTAGCLAYFYVLGSTTHPCVGDLRRVLESPESHPMVRAKIAMAFLVGPAELRDYGLKQMFELDIAAQDYLMLAMLGALDDRSYSSDWGKLIAAYLQHAKEHAGHDPGVLRKVEEGSAVRQFAQWIESHPAARAALLKRTEEIPTFAGVFEGEKIESAFEHPQAVAYAALYFLSQDPLSPNQSLAVVAETALKINQSAVYSSGGGPLRVSDYRLTLVHAIPTRWVESYYGPKLDSKDPNEVYQAANVLTRRFDDRDLAKKENWPDPKTAARAAEKKRELISKNELWKKLSRENRLAILSNARFELRESGLAADQAIQAVFLESAVVESDPLLLAGYLKAFHALPEALSLELFARRSPEAVLEVAPDALPSVVEHLEMHILASADHGKLDALLKSQNAGLRLVGQVLDLVVRKNWNDRRPFLEAYLREKLSGKDKPRRVKDLSWNAGLPAWHLGALAVAVAELSGDLAHGRNVLIVSLARLLGEYDVASEPYRFAFYALFYLAELSQSSWPVSEFAALGKGSDPWAARAAPGLAAISQWRRQVWGENRCDLLLLPLELQPQILQVLNATGALN